MLVYIFSYYGLIILVVKIKMVILGTIDKKKKSWCKKWKMPLNIALFNTMGFKLIACALIMKEKLGLFAHCFKLS